MSSLSRPTCRHAARRREAPKRRYRSDMSRSVPLASRLREPRARRDQCQGWPPSAGPRESQAGRSPRTGA
jgi:hypothetical protein